MSASESQVTRQTGFGADAGDLELVGPRYRPIRVLGTGGMGAVFLAYDLELRRKVAIKRMSVASEAAQQLLSREARALAKLSHPNVVGVFEITEDADGSLSIVMEFVEGRTLDRWLAEVAPDWKTTVRVFLDAGRGLAAAHALGIVHRDFKLSNVMIGEGGRVRVIDFGLARAAKDADPEIGLSTVTAKDGRRIVLGTPVYMSPEQHMGAEIDARSDQYSFCVALFQALYGRAPFPGKTPRDIFRAKIDNALVPRPDDTPVPASVHRILERGLRSDLDDRWPSMHELLQRLAVTIEVPRRLRSAAAVVGVLALGLGLGLGLRAMQDDPCTEVSSLDGVWDDARRAQLGTALATTPAPGFVLARFDDLAEQWQQSSRTLCERSELAERSAAARHSRSCLDARRSELVAFGDLLIEGDTALAASVAAGMSSPADCLRPRSRLADGTDDPSAGLGDELARAGLAAELGRTHAAELARSVLDRARASNDARSTAHALYALGRALWSTGDQSAAEPVLEDAFWGAADAGEHGLAVEAAAGLVLLRAARDDAAGVDHWFALGQASARRLDEEARTTGLLSHAHADALALLGRRDDAAAEYERTIEAYTRGLGPEHPWTAAAHLGAAMLAGDADAARERGRALARESLGVSDGRILATMGPAPGAVPRPPPG